MPLANNHINKLMKAKSSPFKGYKIKIINLTLAFKNRAPQL